MSGIFSARSKFQTTKRETATSTRKITSVMSHQGYPIRIAIGMIDSFPAGGTK